MAELAAAAVVVATYKWKHNTLLSILLGTACNMLLLRLI
ncbi:MAG: AzlD domain-containing protein [Blautia sp.]